MKRPRLTVAFGLMIASIGMLVVLQFFWLKNAYEKAFFDIHQDANLMFRNVVHTLLDSTFARSIESMPDDSAYQVRQLFDTTSAVMWELEKSDTGRIAKVHVLGIRKTIDDSVGVNAIRRIGPGLQWPKSNGQRKFIIKMMPETLNIDSIDFMFRATLQKSGINLPVKILHIRREGGIIHHSRGGFHPVEIRDEIVTRRDRFRIGGGIYGDTVFTEHILYNPMNHYAASITGVRTYLLKQITPQILFSVFLTSLTSLSFLFLHRSIRTQQRLVEMKNDFISNVTHELKTPVATVSVALEALKNFHAMDNPKLTQEYLSIAQGELTRLTQMTDKILSASLEDQKDLNFVHESIDLDNIVHDVLTSMQLVVKKRNGSLRYVKEGTNFKMKGEAAHMRNVIYNLLDNALKYSLGKPDISVSLKNLPHELIFSVRDQGIGISPEFQKRIFEKFFRVPTGDVHNTKGYGLGLSYVANVVKRHSGKIKVESKTGEGSEFTIVFSRLLDNNR